VVLRAIVHPWVLSSSSPRADPIKLTLSGQPVERREDKTLCTTYCCFSSKRVWRSPRIIYFRCFRFLALAFHPCNSFCLLSAPLSIVMDKTLNRLRVLSSCPIDVTHNSTVPSTRTNLTLVRDMLGRIQVHKCSKQSRESQQKCIMMYKIMLHSVLTSFSSLLKADLMRWAC
jgi:hypothetical protein